MKNRSSPLRVECNGWTLDKSLHEVLMLRGAFVAALGTIETTMTELAIRASKHQSYSAIRAKFPSRRPDRLKFVEALCETEGPLQPYRGLMSSAARKFRAELDLRDVLAHGRMEILSYSNGDALVTFEDYSAAGDLITYRREQQLLSVLRGRVYRVARLSRCLDMLYIQMGDILPQIERQPAGAISA